MVRVFLTVGFFPGIYNPTVNSQHGLTVATRSHAHVARSDILASVKFLLARPLHEL